MRHFFLLVLLFFSLSSCIEILDDISFNADGSGDFKYTINLSSSKLKINSILALDSLDGKKVPSISEIKSKIGDLIGVLNCQEGITDVVVAEDYDNFIFKIALHFDNIEFFLLAMRATIESTGNIGVNDQFSYDWISWDGEVLVREVPDLNTFNFRMVQNEDQQLMKSGMYTSISRFNLPVEKMSNPTAVLSKNKRAVMLRNSLFDVFGNPAIMENIISVLPTEN
tara:strand:+ start:210 stop:884 length:675 start_codon:yes stop_codon:yes gene_type:complete